MIYNNYVQKALAIVGVLMLITAEIGGQALQNPTLTLRSRLYNHRRYTTASAIVVEHRLTNVGTSAITVPLAAVPTDQIRYTLTDDTGEPIALRIDTDAAAASDTAASAGVANANAAVIDDAAASDAPAQADATADEAAATSATPTNGEVAVAGEPAGSGTAGTDDNALANGEVASARQITLQPQESWLFRDRIDPRYALTTGIWRLRAEFTLGTGTEAYRLRSAPLRFAIFAPPPAAAAAVPAVVERLPAALPTEQSADKNSAALPDAVVRALLNGLQAEEWQRVYDSLDLTSLYREVPERNERYIASDADRQARLIAEFRDLIRTQNTPALRIPAQYRIIRTEYTDALAVVYAELEFPLPAGVERRAVEYRLRKAAAAWQIYNVSATVIR